MICRTAVFFFLFFYLNCEALLVSDLSHVSSYERGEERIIAVRLTNDKETAEQVNFKLCDYACNAEGEHFFEEYERFPRSNADWITLSGARIILQPKETADYFFKIRIPSDPSLQGSYWSVLLIEPDRPFDPSQLKREEGFQLYVKLRYAYHIVTSLYGGRPKLEIIKNFLTEVDNQSTICIDVKNGGTLFLQPSITLKLFSKDGKLEKTLAGKKERLYPGSSQRYFLDGKGMKEKSYTAFLLLDNGDQYLFGETFPIRFE